MKAHIARTFFAGCLLWAVAANAHGEPAAVQASPSVSPQVNASASPPAAPIGGPQGLTPVPWPSPKPTAPESPDGSVAPGQSAPVSAPAGPLPAPSVFGSPSDIEQSRPSANRFHLHRPGTDVEGDSLAGSLASNVFVLKGDVTLHSDPKIDREIADASESTQPLTVTADEIDVDKISLTYVAKGHVHFTQGTRSGHADIAMLDEEKHTLDLVGDANVFDGDRRAAAAKMHYDMAEKGFFGSGNVRIYEPLPTPNPNASSTPAPKKRKRRIPL